MLRKDCYLGLKQRLKKPWKHSGYEVTIIPNLCKDIPSAYHKGRTRVDCTGREVLTYTVCTLADSRCSGSVYWWLFEIIGHKDREETAMRTGIEGLGLQNPIRNDFWILDSVKRWIHFSRYFWSSCRLSLSRPLSPSRASPRMLSPSLPPTLSFCVY